MERVGIGDHLHGAKNRIFRFVDGRNDSQCLLVGLAAKIPAAKVAVLVKSFGQAGVSHRRFALFARSP